MAKKKIVVKLVSTGGTKHFYTTYRNKKSLKIKPLKKYDPILRRHVIYEEQK